MCRWCVLLRTTYAHAQMTCGRRAYDARMTCVDNVCVTPGVVLHEIWQRRQVFAWVWAINLTSNSWRSGKSDKRKPSWTALHKDKCLTCYNFCHGCSVFSYPSYYVAMLKLVVYFFENKILKHFITPVMGRTKISIFDPRPSNTFVLHSLQRIIVISNL